MLRSELGIEPGKLVLGTVGRLQPQKRQDLLLRTMAALRDHGHAVHGLIVGGDAFGLAPRYAAGLEHLAAELGLAGDVTLTGQIDKVAPYIQLMDVFMNTSEAEAFGIVLVEAMTLGVPVVTVGGGGPLEIISAGHSGVVVDAPDARALERALLPLIGDTQLRQRLAAQGRLAAQRFSASRMATDIQDRFEHLAGVRG
jgi:glycosyltransferase involved in cell wall biosynthesis